MGPLPASLGAPHILPAPEAGWEVATLESGGGGGGRPLSHAGKRPACEKCVPIFRGSGAVSKRETNPLARIEIPERHLPKDLIEIWEVEAFLLSCERLPLLSERAHTHTAVSVALFNSTG